MIDVILRDVNGLLISTISTNERVPIYREAILMSSPRK